MLFGKAFDHVCHGMLYFRDPEGETLALTKRLAELWARANAGAAENDKPCALKKNEWPSVKGIGARAGRPLGRAYTQSLDVRFYITPRLRYANNAAVGFSGGGWIPAALPQAPVALRLGDSSRFEAYMGPGEGWRAVETLKYQANVTYFIEMSIDISGNIYSATAWMLDADGERDAPYCIAKDFPFRLGGDPVIPAMTAIDTIYLGPNNENRAYIIRDFEVVGGE